MHPTIAVAVAAERHADLLRAAENDRRVVLARGAHAPHRPSPEMVSRALQVSQRLRLRTGQLMTLRSARPSAVEACCA